MKALLKTFAKTECGAITTEFLVLAAAIVGLGVASVSGLEGSAPAPEPDVNKTLERFTSGF